MSLDRAQRELDAARQAIVAGEPVDRGLELFEIAAGTARGVRDDDLVPLAQRQEAAQLAIDARYLSAMVPRVNIDASSELLRTSVLDAIAVFEREEYDESLRLYGLYIAQCAAFELAHRSDGQDAERLFADVVACAEQVADLDEVEADKGARLYANGAAAAHTLANLKRERGVKSYTDLLVRASDLGGSALRVEGLPRSMAAETRLVMAEVTFELAITEKEPESALPGLRNALGWARTAAEAEGVDGLFQAQAMQRSADMASVMGLALRHSDFEGSLEVLLGAVELAITAAGVGEAPATVRGPAYDTAVRTLQNVGLLTKERAPHRARDAFQRAVAFADEASGQREMEAWAGKFSYLAASSALELATLVEGIDRDTALVRALAYAREAVASPAIDDEDKARAALVGCGAAARLVEQSAGDAEASAKGLAEIETLARVAAECGGAPEEMRAKGRDFALDAAQRRRSLAQS